MELHALVTRVRGEFIEMPGLRLTMSQATRLWGLEQWLCQTVLDTLVQSSFLRRGEGSTFARADL